MYAKTSSKNVSTKEVNTWEWATALLGVTQNGEKLTLFLIFKAQRRDRGRAYKEVKEIIGYIDDLTYHVQHNTWVDKEIFID